MRAVVQRCRHARVTVDGRVTGEIGPGLCVLLGVGVGDTARDAHYLAEKTANLRVFADSEGKMNLSLLDLKTAGGGGEALVVSQFTLYGDCRRGRRPSYTDAAPPGEADRLYREYVEALRSYGLRVATGEFQAMMTVELANDGPVTLLLDSRKFF
jgi:D-tyrosyl-tRNA(Tyr) deacylase